MIKKKSILFRAVGRANRNIFINNINRLRLKNKDFSIISNNCVGSIISHDLKQRFLSPMVNLFLGTEDFIEFVENLNYYLQLEVEEISKDGMNYPIGKLGELELHFVHYKNIKEAKEKWNERRIRINYNNLFIMMTDNDGCSEETIKRFEKLPYRNKVFYTKKNYNQYEYTHYIKGFEDQKCLGDITMYRNIFGQKLYDSFDYIKWLNS